MVEVASGGVAWDRGVWLVDELVCHICNGLRGAAEEVWRVDPSHGKYKVDAEEDVRV